MLSVHRAAGTYRELVDVYIALTDFARERFIAGGLPASRVVVKPNFVEAGNGDRKHAGNFALYVGRLSPEKGVRTLVRAWREIGTNVPLQLVGSGPLDAELRRLASDLPHVELRGQLPRDEVARLIGSAALLVFPSEWYEGLSLVLLEALAAATPIVASHLSSLDDVVEEGVNAWRFHAGDPQSLAHRVREAWRSPEERVRRGAASRRRYESRFTPEANHAQLIAIYEQARARRSSPS
jgi:glycosyltransferase involved in cell wall biosynthesis